MPRVTVRYFALLRERRGIDTEGLDIADGETATSVYHRLFPDLAQRLPVAYAVDRRYVPGNTELSDGIELALLPPMGGG